MANDSNALALNTPIALSGYTAAGSTSSYSVPYYKTGATAVTTGTANAAVTFTMTYD